MASNREREELHKAIWSIADDLRGVNGKIKCRKSVKINVGFPTFYFTIYRKKFYQIAGRKNKIFCSDSCCKVYWTLHKDKQRRLVPQKYNCIICNKEYFEYPSRNRKYCSRECYYISKRKVVGSDET